MGPTPVVDANRVYTLNIDTVLKDSKNNDDQLRHYSVVAVTGPQGQGKSYLLNQLVSRKQGLTLAMGAGPNVCWHAAPVWTARAFAVCQKIVQ
jgi:ABC-type hemin transport system ATPase subunit